MNTVFMGFLCLVFLAVAPAPRFALLIKPEVVFISLLLSELYPVRAGEEIVLPSLANKGYPFLKDRAWHAEIR